MDTRPLTPPHFPNLDFISIWPLIHCESLSSSWLPVSGSSSVHLWNNPNTTWSYVHRDVVKYPGSTQAKRSLHKYELYQRLDQESWTSQLSRWLSGKESACNAGDIVSISGSGRSPREGNGNPLQYSCWEIPRTEEPVGLLSMGVQKSQTWFSD